MSEPAIDPRAHQLAFVRPEIFDVARRLSSELAATAAERDRAGGTALVERKSFRDSGLLRLTIETELGGRGGDVAEVLDLVRYFSRVDSSLGHLFGFHHLMLLTVRLFGSAEQWRKFGEVTARRSWFWGNALNPLDTRTSLRRELHHYVLDGTKSFSSGSVDADALIVSALDEQKKLVVLALSSGRTGLEVKGDWDNIGQRQTDSGSVVFRQVRIEEDEVLRTPGPLGSVRAGLRPLFAQLSLVNVYLGLAEGGLAAAKSYTRESSRPWARSGVSEATRDPYVLRRYGEFQVAVVASRALADRAAQLLAAALAREDALEPSQRGEVAVAIAAAKVASTRAALEVTSSLFEVTGARATAQHLGLDRFWRNARTHTLHDPLDYKLQELGEYALNDAWPEPGFYS